MHKQRKETKRVCFMFSRIKTALLLVGRTASCVLYLRRLHRKKRSKASDGQEVLGTPHPTVIQRRGPARLRRADSVCHALEREHRGPPPLPLDCGLHALPEGNTIPGHPENQKIRAVHSRPQREHVSHWGCSLSSTICPF